MKGLRWFWIGAAFIFGAGILASIITHKGDFLLWLTQWRQPVLDYFFYYVTKAGELIGFVIIGVWLWVYSWRKMIFIPILGALTTAVTYVLKNVFNHERPSLFLDRIDWQGAIGVMDYHVLQGHSSFPSGHSMAAWALFTFFALIMNTRWISAGCLFLAASVSLSRVYLMAHFLQDVVVGAIIGSILGYGMYRLYVYWFASENRGKPEE